MTRHFSGIPPLSQTDKLCLALLALCFLIPHFAVWAMDAAAERAVEEDKPPVEAVTVTPPIDCTPLVEAVESARDAAQADPYDETIPLSRELQEALREACDANNVALCDALGVIEVESCFKADAVSSEGAYGLFQLNPRYFPSNLTPEENIKSGVSYLGELLNKYDGDTQAALTAYNAGRDTGDRRYAMAVLYASEKWGCG